MPAWLKARESFAGAAVDERGKSVQVDVARGQVVRDDNPAVKGREHLFEPLEDETATAGRSRRTGAGAS